MFACVRYYGCICTNKKRLCKHGQTSKRGHRQQDNHWCWSDDIYKLGYALNMCRGWIRDDLIQFPQALRIELEKGLIALSVTEAY